jgi:hypothetical protein
MDRGVLNFKAGAWNDVSLTVRLGVGNTSSVTLRINDKATTVSGIPMQLGSDQSVRRTIFTTLYGGHTPEWFPKFNTHTIFRNWSYRDLALLPVCPPNCVNTRTIQLEQTIEALDDEAPEAEDDEDASKAAKPPPKPAVQGPKPPTVVVLNDYGYDSYDPYEDDPYATDPV